MWKRWLALLLAGMLVLCMTGCRRTGGGEPSDQKINVYTSKDYETKDFVAQLGNVDYVGLVETSRLIYLVFLSLHTLIFRGNSPVFRGLYL